MHFLNKKIKQLAAIIRLFGSSFLRTIELAHLRVEWGIKNGKNDTFPVHYFPIDLVTVGDYSYGPIDVYTYNAHNEGLEIGKYCSIARDVKFILGGNHRTDCMMTFPVRNKFGGENLNEAISKGKIVLEDDVWIGVGATLLSGIRLGQGCVVAAGSVVTKSFPPFSIIGGNPAKIIKMRFDEKLLQKLETAAVEVGAIGPEEIMASLELYTCALIEKVADDLILILNKDKSS